MRNQKVTAPMVKGFDKRKTTATKPKSDVGKEGKRFESGAGAASLKKLFTDRLRNMKG